MLRKHHELVREDMGEDAGILIFDETGFAKKRGKDAFPQGLGFKTEPQLAAEMLEGIAEEGIVPFKYVVADSVYGESEDFLHAVESHAGVTYLVGIRSDTLCWVDKGPATEMKTSRAREGIPRQEGCGRR